MSVLNSNPKVLTIAGSDSSAGAGVQADLKTISALGGYGCCAITAVTVQNTQGVRSLNPVDADIIAAQCEAVFDDIGICSVKIGMLPNIEAIDAVINILKKYQPACVVWDPVMVATSGDALVECDVTNKLINELLPITNIVTPNLHELCQLSMADEVAMSDAQIEEQSRILLDKGARYVLAKGGHGVGKDATDWLFTNEISEKYIKPRIKTNNTHGTGCTLSSAIACLRPQLPNMQEAVLAAKNYVQIAIAEAVDWQLGKGHGPIDHFHSGRAYRFSGVAKI
ncbi:MAG: bifunctional hydroxymethylpyrimidine kinase/phosphomethylpyrimidine kinase [Neisseriaceae bacterium]|nr:bifunctional hydroxymethylpyrimidine kinase/phosphomethylpyrimidine kinase [Neisseriaceae bacterium]